MARTTSAASTNCGGSEPLYRFFQPILTLLGRFNRILFPASLAEIGRQIQAAGLTRFWLPEEYLAPAAN